MNDYAYVGTELDLFARATNWKAYWSERFRPFLGRRVLDVGAGLGASARLLAGSVERWTCLEPDPSLARRLAAAIQSGELPSNCEVVTGRIQDIVPAEQYDSVLYVDVLEHIEGDREELSLAAERLRPGGHLIVLCPAHRWLFSRFDEAVGHFRRYDKTTLCSLAPVGCVAVSLAYLDSVGLLLSLGNAVVLRRAVPTPVFIGVWDQLVVSLSRRLDPLLRFSVGRSIAAIWRKSGLVAPGPRVAGEAGRE